MKTNDTVPATPTPTPRAQPDPNALAAMASAFQFGFLCAEKGMNMEAALATFYKTMS